MEPVPLDIDDVALKLNSVPNTVNLNSSLEPVPNELPAEPDVNFNEPLGVF